MRILIANDDGITAPGIRALVDAFAGAGHEIYVCAPDGQRSAASHALTMRAAIPVREMQIAGAKAAWAIGGTPVDCVKLGLITLCPQAEFVISGVNHGVNIGSDVLYSGTVGAAMEGALMERPAMAVSLAYEREDTYDKAAALAVQVFDRLREHPLVPGTLMNLNYPATDETLGLVAAPLRSVHLRYNDEYRREALADGTAGYALYGGMDKHQPLGDDDYSWLMRGYATATVLSFDMTDELTTQSLKTWL